MLEAKYIPHEVNLVEQNPRGTNYNYFRIESSFCDNAHGQKNIPNIKYIIPSTKSTISDRMLIYFPPIQTLQLQNVQASKYVGVKNIFY